MTNKEIRRRFMSDMKLGTLIPDCIAAELNITPQQLRRALWPIHVKYRIKHYGACIRARCERAIASLKPQRTRWVVFLVSNKTFASQLVGVFKTQQAANYAVQHRMRPPLVGFYKVQ